MMKEISIRLRLTIWYSAVLLAGLILLGYTAWFSLRQRLVTEFDGRIARQAEGLRTALDSEGVADDLAQLREEVSESTGQMPVGSVIQIRTKTGKLVSSSMESWPITFSQSGANEFSTIQHNSRNFRALKNRIYCAGRPLDLFIAIPSDQIDGMLQAFRAILWTMIPGMLAIAGLGGWWISRRALAPVDDITNIAKLITMQNLSQRLTVPQTGDELQRMSETWNAVLTRLESAVERTRQFTADASHELRTPVALIRATAELALRRERSADEYQTSLRQILLESERMTQLTNDLLFLSAADATRLDMPVSPVGLNALVSESIKESSALAQSRGICLSLDLHAEQDLVSVNEAGLKRLMLIFIDNALKFTPPNGSVIVSTATDKEGIIVSVRDSGPGIQPEAIPHIFERFYQADPSHNGNNGAGLGLSIAQMIAVAHGSSIRVESAPDAGSCFSITLKK